MIEAIIDHMVYITGAIFWIAVVAYYAWKLLKVFGGYLSTKFDWVRKNGQIIRFILSIYKREFSLTQAQKLQSLFQDYGAVSDDDVFARKKQLDMLSTYIGRIISNASFMVDESVKMIFDNHNVYRDAVVCDIDGDADHYDIQYFLPDGAIATLAGVHKGNLKYRRDE